MPTIHTKRLRLVCCTEPIVQAILEGDAAIAKLLQINVAPDWSMYGRQIFEYTLDKLKTNPDEKEWWAYFPILKESNSIIGSCGYKGKPDAAGMVEIGYEVAKSYRQNGYATEVAGGLVDHAFKQEGVTRVWAHTLAELNPSTRVLQNNQFVKIEDVLVANVDPVWKWERLKLRS